MTGTSGRQRVPASSFDLYKIVVPPPELAYKFGEIAKMSLQKMKANDEQSQTLADLRDALLPKLVSGAVRVPAVAEMLEDV
jgi:type I restriction enzyme S subunit